MLDTLIKGAKIVEATRPGSRGLSAPRVLLRCTRQEVGNQQTRLLTSVESWEQFRLGHGRTPLQTRRAWSDAIERVLQAR